MYSANHWGGSFEINAADPSSLEVDDDKNMGRSAFSQDDHNHNHLLDEIQQSWLLGPQDKIKKKKYVDFGFIVCSHNALRWTLYSLLIAFFVIALPIIISNSIHTTNHHQPPPDNYTQALKTALLFFNAQMSGRLPKDYNVPWREDSGLRDGLSDNKRPLVGGYYDAGDNTKFHFPMAFSMTMLSWSVIEYSQKYKAIGEYDHVRQLIKWGTDYLLLTFNSSATIIDQIYSQVGGSQNGSTTPDDHFCWQRPEDMSYPRPVQIAREGPDLAGEMAAALASASIVFWDDIKYSKKLLNGATALYNFAVDRARRNRYSKGNPYIAPYYMSTDYFDEYMWSATWMYYATGNATTYLKRATDREVAKNAKVFDRIPDLSVLSWDNKLPAAELLLTRFRMFLSPGYPYEDMLSVYHDATGHNMCSYLQEYNVFNWTKGGMVQLNHGSPQPLQYVANAAFLASLFIDYMTANNIPGWYCGSKFMSSKELHRFATSQVDYILGANPMNMSYLVGYGDNFPKHVHHRGSSIPNHHRLNNTTNGKYSCKGGWIWFNSTKPNPNEIKGAMVGGPYKSDSFRDDRKDYGSTEPTLAGNAGLVAALVSLTTSGGIGTDRNTIFLRLPSLYPSTPPPPSPWKP
ncbi:Endoglucanase [Thalictrum thalictroides]|uniref:Endoglucanase n=1 Tax=Thalictrum thalictroides TaxID=46969 RepID=A0A7J6UZG7_THATH|nr:Endoglucanase [Thalictrum thalictroides]